MLPPGLGISGEVLLGQVRSIDTLARPIAYAGEAVAPDVLAQARAKLAALLGM